MTALLKTPRSWLVLLVALACLSIPLLAGSATGQTPDRILTAAVLVNSANPTGFNISPTTPGEFQRFVERYLEHLQVPYDLIDVSTTAPPSNLGIRQLIVAGHRTLNLSAAWGTAIQNAVQGGVGFVNFDSATNIGTQSHIQAIFGATGSAAGTAATTITVPGSVRPGGPAAHFITALQEAFARDTVNAAGDIIRSFHQDQNGVVQTATSTVLTGTTGTTVLARLGNDPLILARAFGQGRAVHFGTLDYLRADRFGFVMGVDDLFWRSLAWAARKPFVVRGYPRLFSIQLDDSTPGWGFRVRDLYDPALTGTVNADGTGGPWKVTGYLWENNLPPGSPERAVVTEDIRQGKLLVAPHDFVGVTFGDMYWNQSAGQLTDQQWLNNLNTIQQWKQGQGGNDTIPRFSRSMVAHFWDLSNNTGWDLWNTLGFRYVTSIQKPGFQNFDNVTINNGAERLNARPFRLYEMPPKTVKDENYSMLYTDDYVVGSRAGLASQTFFLFTTQLQDAGAYPRPDAIWPSANFSLTESLEQWQRYTWRFWSSQAPVQIYTHDALNMELSSASERQEFVRQLSTFLNQNGARHIFMENLGDYIRARTKSRLVDVRLFGNDLTYTFTGDAATAENVPVATRVLVTFDNSSEGVFDTVQGFVGGAAITQPVPPPPPGITSISPTSGPISGGTPVGIAGTNFVGALAVTIGGQAAGNVVVNGPTSISAVTAPGTTGPADVSVSTSTGAATLLSGFTYVGPPVISGINPNFGPAAGGTTITITGAGFVPTSTATIGGASATNIVVTDSSTLTAVTPPGTSGAKDVAVSNAQGTTTVSGGFIYFSGDDVIRLNFNYASRQQALAAGWDFLARTATGGVRNTEQTSGLIVSYNQTLHPGAIRIPADSGDLYQNLNNSRNTLFFTLPDAWRSLRMKIRAFSPNAEFQQAALLAYQDDNNYVVVSRYFNTAFAGNQLAEFGVEAGGGFASISRTTGPAAPLFLRLDRVTSTNTFSSFTSTDGTNWTPLSGSVSRTLANARLGVLVGANESTTSFPNADIEFVEILVLQDPPALQVAPQQLTFSGVAGASSPAAQSLTISNTGGGVLSWSASDNASWLSLSPTSGNATPTSPGTLSAAVNTTGLSAGSYAATITVTAPGASGSPQNIPVTLTLSPPSPPTISGVSPGFGPAAGGTQVTITGSGFINGTIVIFGSGVASNVVVSSANSLTATTPAGPAGAVNVTVSNSNGTGTLPGGFTYAVTGTVLMSDDFNDGNANGWLASPLGNAGGWSVVNGALTYNGGGHTQFYRGDAGWSDYTFEAGIRLTSLNNYPGGIRGRVDPSTGAGYAAWLYPASGQIVLYRVTGWNIDSTGLTQLGAANGIAFDAVNFHRLRLTFQGTQIQVHWDGVLVLTATDTTNSSGLLALDVANQAVAFDNVTVVFGAPGSMPILSVSPDSIGFTAAVGGPNPSPQTLTISNTGEGSLSWAASDDAAWISVTPTSGTAPTTATVSVNTSGLGQGTHQGTITITASGASGSPKTVPVTLTITAPVPPAVSAVSPTFGPVAGGTQVTITGNGFTAGTTVTFGGAAASNVTVVSGTSMTAVTPARPAGPSDVVVSNTNGTATRSGGFTYVVPGTLLLSDDFNDGNANGWQTSPLGNAAGWSVVSGALTYNGGGHTQLYRGDTGWTDYAFEVGVRLTSLNNYPGGIRGRVNPSTGTGYAAWLYPAGGQIVLYRVTGWNIDSPGLTLLASTGGIAFNVTNFNRLRLTFLGNQIQVHWNGVPILSATDTTYASGLVAFDVSNQGVAFDDVTVAFGSPPTVSSISPTSGPTAGGTQVTISGSGFVAGTTVAFGGAAASSVTIVSGTSMTAVTPARPAGPADVVVSNANGTATLSGGFTYVAPGTVLMSDDFNDGNAAGWQASPLGNAAGWSVVSGALTYNGGGHTQFYQGDGGWSGYSFEVGIRLASLNNFPGGIRGRVNPTTGAGYAAWLYPASGQIILYRATAWDINTAGLTQLGAVSGITFDPTNFHRLRLTFLGSQIQVHWDGVLVLSATDTEYFSGVVALDVANQFVTFDDVAVISNP